jgi:hypothetical protein
MQKPARLLRFEICETSIDAKPVYTGPAQRKTKATAKPGKGDAGLEKHQVVLAKLHGGRVIEIEFARSGRFWIPVLKFRCSERNGVNFVRLQRVRSLQFLARKFRDAEDPLGLGNPSGNINPYLVGQSWIYVTKNAKDRQCYIGYGLVKYAAGQEMGASVFFSECANPGVAERMR